MVVVIASRAKRTLTKSEIAGKVVAANLQSNEQDSYTIFRMTEY